MSLAYIQVERPARSDEPDIVARGYTFAVDRDSVSCMYPEALAHMFEGYQLAACTWLECDVSELAWRGYTPPSDEEVARIARSLVGPDAAVAISRIPSTWALGRPPERS